jgi:hypothetical protein
MDSFKIPEYHIFSSRDLKIASAIKHIVSSGVDVVFRNNKEYRKFS